MKVKTALRTPSVTPTKASSKAALLRSRCPVNLVMEMVGDSWSMLILRDMMFKGHKSYQAFLRSDEKIATNILADRLVKLEAHGLITKGPDPADARRFIYALTEKGAELVPILVEVTLFGSKHAKVPDFPKEVLESMRRNKQAYALNLMRTLAPKPKRRPAAKREAVEETLSLF
jgi:DNA-binding HxlR family transcriptional regulator